VDLLLNWNICVESETLELGIETNFEPLIAISGRWESGMVRRWQVESSGWNGCPSGCKRGSH